MRRLVRRLWRLVVSWSRPPLRPSLEIAELVAPALEIAALTHANGYEIALLVAPTSAWTKEPA